MTTDVLGFSETGIKDLDRVSGKTRVEMMAHEPQFWTTKGLVPNCFLGEYIPNWADLPTGLPVVLSGRNLPTIGGYVDSKMENGSAIWIRDETWARRLVHYADGYMVRVVIRRPSPSTAGVLARPA